LASHQRTGVSVASTFQVTGSLPVKFAPPTPYSTSATPSPSLPGYQPITIAFVFASDINPWTSTGRPPSTTTTQPLVAVQVPLPPWVGVALSPIHSAYDCTGSETTRMPTWHPDETTRAAPTTEVTPWRIVVPTGVISGCCQPSVQAPICARRLSAPLPV